MPLGRRITSAYSAQTMEELEFIIYPDGRVVEKVTGIVGSSCAEVTAALEEQLGIVLNQQKTSEFYAPVVQQSGSVTNQATYSDW
jgi:hypothetical protein